MLKKGNFRVIVSSIMIVAMVMLLLSGCAKEATPSPTSKQIAISTAASGGAFYPIGAAMSEIINNSNIGIQARAQITGGAVENVKLVNDGTTELGITISYLAYNGYNGIDPYPSKMQNIRTLLSGLSTGVLQIVVLDESPIKKISDLKGKKVAVGPAGGGALTALNDVFKKYDMKFTDIKASYVSYDEGVTMLTDNSVDAAVVYASIPTPAVMTLAAGKKPFRLLAIEDDLLKKLLVECPYYVLVSIKSKTYGLPADVEALGTPNIVIVNKNLSDDQVYKILSAFFDQKNLDIIHNSQPSAKGLNLANAAKSSIPLHPGAEKYYKEKGIIQ